MRWLNNWLPPTKYLLLQVIAILLAVFYGLVGFNNLMLVANDGFLLRLPLGLFFCLLTISTWRLRYWAFQLTCMVLLGLSLFSPFVFFPMYGFGFQVEPSVYTLFWPFILFNICSLSLVAIVQFMKKSWFVRFKCFHLMLKHFLTE